MKKGFFCLLILLLGSVAVFGGGRTEKNQAGDGEVVIHYHKHSDGKDTAQQLIDMFNFTV